MRITVIGGTGLIGTKLVGKLRAEGHDVVVAARATGVNSYTGEGLEQALSGAEVVIDVSNSSYTDEAAAREFFYASTMNLLTYGDAAGVGHHVALSVVGTDRLARAQGGYFIAKEQQERLLTASRRPFSIVHATQFFEFVRSITDAAMRSGVVRVADVLIQPMAADGCRHRRRRDRSGLSDPGCPRVRRTRSLRARRTLPAGPALPARRPRSRPRSARHLLRRSSRAPRPAAGSHGNHRPDALPRLACAVTPATRLRSPACRASPAADRRFRRRRRSAPRSRTVRGRSASR